MRNPNLSSWNFSKTKAGLLLFAQCLEERLFDYSLDWAFDPASDPAKQSAARAKLEPFVVHSDGVHPLNGTVVKSKSNIRNN